MTFPRSESRPIEIVPGWKSLKVSEVKCTKYSIKSVSLAINIVKYQVQVKVNCRQNTYVNVGDSEESNWVYLLEYCS